MIKSPARLIVAVVIVVVLFGGGFAVGRLSAPTLDRSVQPRPAYNPLNSAEARLPFVQDAMRRWAAKDGLTVERALRGRSIHLVNFPDKSCVEFGLVDFDVGGVPVYCYRPNSTQLVEEHSDVE